MYFKCLITPNQSDYISLNVSAGSQFNGSTLPEQVDNIYMRIYVYGDDHIWARERNGHIQKFKL